MPCKPGTETSSLEEEKMTGRTGGEKWMRQAGGEFCTYKYEIACH